MSLNKVEKKKFQEFVKEYNELCKKYEMEICGYELEIVCGQACEHRIKFFPIDKKEKCVNSVELRKC